jgi:hypothetical protein
MVRAIYILIILLLVSCTAKKTSTTRIIERDTLRTASAKYISKPIKSTFYFPDICDTTGVYRRFKQMETSGENSANISFRDNALFLELMTGQSENKTDTIVKYVYRGNDQLEKVVKYKTPLWMWVALILSILINIILLRFTFFR